MVFKNIQPLKALNEAEQAFYFHARERRRSLAGIPELFQTHFVDTFGVSWDLAPDGRFLVIKPSADDSDPSELRIVLNWFEELKRLVPTD